MIRQYETSDAGVERGRVHAEVYRSQDVSAVVWRFHVIAGNGEILASGESYDSERDARHGLALVVGPGVKVQVLE